MTLFDVLAWYGAFVLLCQVAIVAVVLVRSLCEWGRRLRER